VFLGLGVYAQGRDSHCIEQGGTKKLWQNKISRIASATVVRNRGERPTADCPESPMPTGLALNTVTG
jgi:hypothetical protein